MKNLVQNFKTTAFMKEEIEAEIEVKEETKTQKVVNQEHLPHMRGKIVQEKNALRLINKGSIQNIRLKEEKDLASLYENTKKKK